MLWLSLAHLAPVSSSGEVAGYCKEGRDQCGDNCPQRSRPRLPPWAEVPGWRRSSREWGARSRELENPHAPVTQKGSPLILPFEALWLEGDCGLWGAGCCISDPSPGLSCEGSSTASTFPPGTVPPERALEPPQAAGLEMVASCPLPSAAPGSSYHRPPVLPRGGPSCYDLCWSIHPCVCTAREYAFIPPAEVETSCRRGSSSCFLGTSCCCSVVSDSLRPHGLQHTRLPCPSLSPGFCSSSCPLS